MRTNTTLMEEERETKMTNEKENKKNEPERSQQ